jgi:DNA repair exonuclease SbcCD ATPase subunit
MPHETAASTELVQHLNTQSTRIQSLRAHLEALNTARQNQSHLTRLAFFYGELSWWKKIGVASVFFLLPTLASLLFGLSFFPLIPLAAGYFSGIFLLSNHYDQDHNLHHNALKTLESILTESIEALTETCDRFDKRIEALTTLHQAEQTEHTELKQHIENIENTNQRYQATTQHLTEPVEQLCHTTNTLQEKSQTLIEILSQTNIALTEALEDITEQLLPNLDESIETIKQSQHTFAHLQTQFQRNMLHMNSFVSALDTTLHELETTNQAQDESDTLSNEKTRLLTQSAEEVLAEASAFIEKARQDQPYPNPESSVKIEANHTPNQ